MDSDKSVTAVFTPDSLYELTITIQGSGSVSLSSFSGTYASGGAYAFGTNVTLTANPDPDWSFDHWEIDLTGNANPDSLTMDSDKFVTAVFTPDGVIRVEAEDMTLSNYSVEAQGGAWSGGDGIKLSASAGTAQTTPPAGTYDVVVRYFDESDGASTIEIRVDDNLEYTLNLTQNNEQLNSTTVLTNYTFGSNTVFKIEGHRNDGEYCRVDYVDFIGNGGGGATQYTLTTNVQGSGSISLDLSGGVYDPGTDVTLTPDPDPNWSFHHWEGDLSGSANPVTLTMNSDMSITAVFTEDPGSPIRFEAEDMTLSNYSIEAQGGNWSGGDGIKLSASDDTAEITTPPVGTYDVVVRYLDETDGPASIEIRVDGDLEDTWSLNQNTGQLISRTVLSNYTFGSNTVFEIEGLRNDGEYCRVDYVEFVQSSQAKLSSNDQDSPELPAQFRLLGNFPNPFNPTTTIRYEIPATLAQNSKVVLEIFNILGRKIRTLVNANQGAGQYTIEWDGRSESGNVVTSGIYLYRVAVGNQVLLGKMSLLK